MYDWGICLKFLIIFLSVYNQRVGTELYHQDVDRSVRPSLLLSNRLPRFHPMDEIMLTIMYLFNTPTHCNIISQGVTK